MNEAWLAHHGILGQKWGVRRFQNKDGSLTKAGKERYAYVSDPNRKYKKKYKEARDEIDKLWKEKYNKYDKLQDEAHKEYEKYIEEKTGMSVDDAYDKAYSQSADIREGRLKYEDSIWYHINNAEDNIFYGDSYVSKQEKLTKEYNKKMAAAGQKFLDEYFKDHSKITWDEMSNLYKKTYNYEHEEWYNDHSVDVIFDRVDDMNDYEFGWDEDGNPAIFKRSKSA